MKLYEGMNPNLTLLDFIERYVSEPSEYAAYNIVCRIDQMNAEDYTAATDLLAELTGKNPSWLVYVLNTEARSYAAHMVSRQSWRNPYIT